MAFGLRWSGTRVFLATEIRVQLHEWLAIVTGTLTPGALLIFVAVLAPGLLPITLIGALVYSMFLIGQRVLNEAAYIRIDHKLNELYHASPLSPEGYFVGIAGGMLVAYLPPSLVILGILPPVFYPFSRVPIEWRSVVLIVPTSAAAILVNAAAGLESVTRQEATIAATALGLEAVSLFVFGIYWARRTARER